MSIDKFLKGAQRFQAIIEDLKKDSQYYPDILIRRYEPEEREEEKPYTTGTQQVTKAFNTLKNIVKEPDFYQVFGSTLVRIQNDNKWHVVHVVENITGHKNISEHEFTVLLLQRIMKQTHNIQHLYVPSGKIINPHNGKPLDELDPLQISEQERLIKQSPFK